MPWLRLEHANRGPLCNRTHWATWPRPQFSNCTFTIYSLTKFLIKTIRTLLYSFIFYLAYYQGIIKYLHVSVLDWINYSLYRLCIPSTSVLITQNLTEPGFSYTNLNKNKDNYFLKGLKSPNSLNKLDSEPQRDLLLYLLVLFLVHFLQLQDLILVMVSSRSRLISLKFKIRGKRTVFSTLGLVLITVSQEFILGPITVTSVLESIDWQDIGLVPILGFRRWGQAHLNHIRWVWAAQSLQKNWGVLTSVWCRGMQGRHQ